MVNRMLCEYIVSMFSNDLPLAFLVKAMLKNYVAHFPLGINSLVVYVPYPLLLYQIELLPLGRFNMHSDFVM